MRKIKVDNSLPAFLDSFSKDERNEKFSRAKLKVFYIGETADHRVIDEECARILAETLPYTPVVSFYDAEKDDFVGHASEQSIYGMVDPCVKPEFVEEDGVKWLVCDVVLYTERPDSVGRIAQKIVGHPQSLEMDARTMQYVVNYSTDHKIKTIEFKKGEFVGVSILGKQQKPAFTGSEFFSTSNFEEKMNMLKDYCERGKTEMDEQTIKCFSDLSWSDKQQSVAKALSNTYYCYVIDMYDEYTVA